MQDMSRWENFWFGVVITAIIGFGFCAETYVTTKTNSVKKYEIALQELPVNNKLVLDWFLDTGCTDEFKLHVILKNCKNNE